MSTDPQTSAAQPTRSCCAGGATADADTMAEFAEYMAERREKAERERAVTPNPSARERT